ncbi:putative cross-wall-targeting lipoprotein signal domain-containing proteiin [Streptococcus macacae]|uniref:Cross-wall-targeting lipoprotein signal n=1 Tax=Streptococcus macacae NCTC 11558 TaxID=764298 RepID=G5JUE2_9STRE|nr:putative cross-wall-targeting lipoprotein signal domain-containing proteiin [Streptococcus macacae]EHJ51590.1 putative cross-wall-targeting lipoprotein signal [Streptococcus macacae NCTC 11558]SUN78505.1 cell wall protein, WapE [Streptococcus macacae NCTC 11558]
MEKKIFSKRKTKVAGLCGAVLTSAAIAMGTSAPIQADETAEAAPQVNVEAAEQTQTSEQETSAQTQAATETSSVAETEASTSTAAEQNNPQSSLQTVTQADQTASQAQAADQQTVADTNNTSNKPSTAATDSNTNASSSQQTRASQASNSSQTAANHSTKEAYGSTNFDSTLNAYDKSANVADIVYNGKKDEFIVVNNPNAKYEPNAQEIAKYLNEYLTELRRINNINIPVPPVSQLMQNYAQARADEEAKEQNGLDHGTKLDFPNGPRWRSENGHMDSFDTIRRTNAQGQTLSSDKATAYYLALNWFADYFNILANDNDGKQTFGHAISILGTGGNAMGLGFAAGQGNERDSWYAQLEFSGTNDGVDTSGFSAARNANGEWVLYYNGRPVRFLPNTTFWYIQAAANPNHNNRPNQPQDPGANGQPQKPAAGQKPVTAKAKLIENSNNALSSNSDQTQLLPNTGDKQSTASTLAVLGGTLALAGLGIYLLSKRQFKK